MYSRKEASKIRSNFWTRFGQYMAPVQAAGGMRVNWINYKTGIKHVRFTMDFTNKHAEVHVLIDHPEPDKRQSIFQQFQFLEKELFASTSPEWIFFDNEKFEGKERSRITVQLEGVNIFKEETWPEAVRFFKRHIMGLDEFWEEYKDVFSMLV